jgi:hypothetical protein
MSAPPAVGVPMQGLWVEWLPVWHEWQQDSCPQTTIQDTPLQLPAGPSQPRTGTEDQSGGMCRQTNQWTKSKATTHFKVLCDLAHQPLEGQFPNKEFCRLLVPSDLTQSDGTGAEPMGLLHTTGCCLSTRRVRSSTWVLGKRRHSRQSYEPPMTWQRVVYEGLCLHTAS